MTFIEAEHEAPGVVTPGSCDLDDLWAAIRSATRTPLDWQVTADEVAQRVRSNLPSEEQVLRFVPLVAHRGHDRSQVLHVEPDGSFSVVALISRPGQATTIHDHTTWCTVGVVAGTEREERFRLDETGDALELIGVRTDGAATVSAFAPPGDIHRVTNSGAVVGISLHIYGTDINRIGNSVRRVYDLPVHT